MKYRPLLILLMPKFWPGCTLGEAERIYQQSTCPQACRQCWHRAGIFPELAALARLTLRQGDPQQARRYVEEILEIECGHPHRFMPDLYFDAYAIDIACYEVLQACHD